ncbi:hypothetical protein [Lactobacillus delbrueckii]|nr:hypothetical protein [Lactobacillus delbrueckii]MDM7512847.1 hypothetical protein [Lactobacillus delbrueckii]
MIVQSPWLVRPVADHFYALIPDSKVDQAIRNVHDAIIGDEAFGVSIRAGIYPLSASDQQVSFAMDRARIAANNAVSNYQNYYCRYEQKMEADLTLANYLLGHIDEAVAKGWINVLNALYPFSGSNHQELVENRFVSVMVFLDKGGDFDIIYANKASKSWTESLRLKGEDYAVAIKEEFCALLRQLVSQTDGEIIEKSFRIKDYAGRLRLQLVAEMSGQRAYVISTNMV